MKLAFSLNKPKPPSAAPSLKRPAPFGSFEEDDTVDGPSASTSGNKHGTPNATLLAKNVVTSKTLQKRMEAEMKVDATVYEYDEVWDKMQEAKQKKKEVKELEAKERKPKYINELLTSAATRKLDHLRAEEKLMQRERELEGDMYKDKEAFVTQAYKDQMAEVRRAEEEERLREELQKKQRGQTSGMAHFYRKLLDESEASHEATVAATQKKVQGPQGPTPNLTIVKPPEAAKLSDVELAKLAKEEGKDVELNDDNQIVDRRELLAAGLNLSGINTRKLGGLSSAGLQKNESDIQAHRAVGTAASRREINERRTREIQEQLRAEKERIALEKRKAEDDALQRSISRRNNADDVNNARERYLQRKRLKMDSSAVEQGMEDDN